MPFIIEQQSNSCSSYRNKVLDDHWRFLLTGGVALDNPNPNPYPEWLSDKSWGEIVRASALPGLHGLYQGTLLHDHSIKALHDSAMLRRIFSKMERSLRFS